MHGFSEKDKQDADNRIEAISIWLADPFNKITIEEMGKEFGITKSGMYVFMTKWRKQIDYKVEQKRKEFLPKLKTAAMKALVIRLSKSDKALQMALEISGAYIPRSETTQTVRNETEQKAYVEALLERLKKQEGPVDTGSIEKDAPEEKS